MLKKVLAVVLVGMMVLYLAACSGEDTKEETTGAATTETSESESESTSDSSEQTGSTSEEAVADLSAMYPDETILIAVEIYDSTDSEFLAMKDYFEYLAESFNVEFKFSEAITDAEMEMKFIEDSAVAGAKAFMAYYNVTGIEQINKVIEYDMFFWGRSEDEETYSAYKDHPKYLGSIDTGDLNYFGGGAMGEWVLEQGFDKVIYANGGADFGVSMFVARQEGFYAALGDADVEVIVVSGFPSEQFFADQAAALGTEGLDAVVASFNGVDFWAQPIATAGLDDVQLATFGSVNQSYVDAFNSGSVDLVVSGNIQAYGLVVPMVVNAVDGNADQLKIDGMATKAPISGWVVDSAELCETLNSLQDNERVYKAEDFKQLIVNLNSDANGDLLQSVLDQGSIENLTQE